MIATDGAVKKPTGGMYGVASSPHSPNSALGLDGGADLGCRGCRHSCAERTTRHGDDDTRRGECSPS
jgi:hypothetical protein